MTAPDVIRLWSDYCRDHEASDAAVRKTDASRNLMLAALNEVGEVTIPAAELVLSYDDDATKGFTIRGVPQEVPR